MHFKLLVNYNKQLDMLQTNLNFWPILKPSCPILTQQLQPNKHSSPQPMDLQGHLQPPSCKQS